MAVVTSFSKFVGRIVRYRFTGSTEILDLNSLTWRAGAETIPTSTGELSSIVGSSIPTSNGHIVVGGNDGENPVREIFRYDLDTDEWTVMEQKLSVARQSHVIIPIPRDEWHC